jgi:hypothetical protein
VPAAATETIVSDIEPPEHPEHPEPTESSDFAEFFHTDELPDGPNRVRQPGTVELSPFFARLLAPVTSVAVVIVVVVLLIWINGGSSGDKQSAAAVQTKAGHSVVSGTARKHHKASPHAASSATGHAAHHPGHAGRAGHSGGSAPAASPSTAASTAHRRQTQRLAKARSSTATAPVTVLNNSRRTGLAHAAAAQIHAKGWKIATIGNLQGLVPLSTIYYAPGHAAAAKHLAHDFSSVRRVEPNHNGHMHGSALTLVVTAAWRL